MGMFDYVRCELPLPDGFDGELQTKDFDCDLGQYVVTKEGRLMLAVLDRIEAVPKAERSYPDAEEGTLEAIIGSVRHHWRYIDANHHGIVRFYGCDPDNGWHEYRAKFTDGQLVEITQIADGEVEDG